MKFAEHLSAHITPEWRKQYINYEEMKAMLYVAVEEAPSMESADENELTRHFKNFKETFFAFCDTELKKINTFYSEKLAEATRKFATLKSELSTTLNVQSRTKSKTNKLTDMMIQKPRNVPARKLQDLKLAFSEYYLSLILLQNYQNLNFTGFRKILKKHDKLLNTDQGAKYREEFVEAAHFHTNTDIGRLISEVENTVTNDLEAGDRQKAMKRLRVPPLGEKQTPWTTFKVGLFSGSFIVLFCAVLLSAIYHNEDGADLKTTFKLFRAPLLIVEFLFLIGVNIYGWRSSGVNHVLIFELDPRNHLSEQDLMELAAIMGVVWTLSLLCFFYSPAISDGLRYYNPLGLVIIMILFLLNPFKVLRHDARLWTVRVMWKCIAAPFFYVNFADFWLADQFNSLVTVFTDVHYIFYFYVISDTIGDPNCCSGTAFIVSKSVVNCIPAWMRFCQCLRRYRDSKEAFPHLVNAGKYSTTFFVVVFNALRTVYKDDFRDGNQDYNPYFYLWFASNVISTLYAYAWDIWMDWGLCDANAGDNRFLREEIVYSSKSFYYFAIIEDLILRLSWLFTHFATSSANVDSELMTSITAPLEVFRRFVWNFFRLENEHLNNCGKFRAVRDISVAPIDSSDHGHIIRMMDDLDGVFNRNQKKKPPKKHKEDKRALLGRQNSDQVSISISGLSTPVALTPGGTPSVTHRGSSGRFLQSTIPRFQVR